MVGYVIGAVLGGLASMTAVAAAGEQFLPVLVTREGLCGLFRHRAPMATSPI